MGGWAAACDRRQQQQRRAKGIPTEVTLAAGPNGGGNASRKRNRAKKAA